MKIGPISVLFFALVFGTAYAEDADQPVDGHWNPACEQENQNMSGINDCAFKRFKKADIELNKLYKQKMAGINTQRNQDRFRTAQRAWVSYRDRICLYESGAAEESGSVWPYNHYGCLEFHTKRRIEDMKVYLKCETDDCPD